MSIFLVLKLSVFKVFKFVDVFIWKCVFQSAGPEELTEESSLPLIVSLGACGLALVATLCIVCHRKRHRRRRPNIIGRGERRPFAPPLHPLGGSAASGLDSSRPSLSLPTEVPAPPSTSLFTTLPPLPIDSVDHVWDEAKMHKIDPNSTFVTHIGSHTKNIGWNLTSLSLSVDLPVPSFFFTKGQFPSLVARPRKWFSLVTRKIIPASFEPKSSFRPWPPQSNQINQSERRTKKYLLLLPLWLTLGWMQWTLFVLTWCKKKNEISI